MGKSREYEQMMEEEEKNDMIFLIELLWIIASRLYDKKGEWQRDSERYHSGIGD